MSGRRFRRAAAAAALGLGAVLGALAALYGEDVPIWSIPLLAAAVLILFELVSLSRGPAPDAAVERPAVTAVLVGRLLVAALLAFAGATVALLAAAVPARHGLATGLFGAAAAATLFLLVAAVARRGERGLTTGRQSRAHPGSGIVDSQPDRTTPRPMSRKRSGRCQTPSTPAESPLIPPSTSGASLRSSTRCF